MQRLSGALMVLAGTALGGYMVLPAPNKIGDRSLEIARHAQSPAQTVERDSSTSLITSALAQAQSADSTAAMPAQPGAVAAATTAGTRVFSPAQPLQAAPSITSTWSAVVTSEPDTSSKFSSSKPGDTQARAALAGDLQRELKRVGCYGGDITGTWTPSTKAAMSAFMERVNASLPIEEPDYILLTLVQGHAAAACGSECPSGQAMSAGKCVPQAVVAQASRKAQRDEDRRALEARKAQQQERLAEEQRAAEAKRVADARKAAEAQRLADAAQAKMAADKARADRTAAEKVAADKAAADAARVAAITPPAPKPAVRPVAPAQKTAAVEPERLPWLADSNASAAPTTTAAITPPVARPAPLPGMMSVGAPIEAPSAVAAIVPERALERAPQSKTIPTASDDRLQPPPVVSIEREHVEPAIPRRAARPQPVVRHAAIPGLPGSKSGVAVQGMPGSKSGVTVRAPITRAPVAKYKYQAARIVRRPPPIVITAPKPKYYSYASSSGGKTRRGQPRPGSMQYNVMHSLGGIY